VDYAFSHPEQVRIKIFYFTWEISSDEKYRQFISYMLFKRSGGKIKLSNRELKSIDPNKILKPEILELLKTDDFRTYFEFFNTHVVFISDIRNATGVYKFCRDYAHNNGEIYYKKQIITDKETHLQKEIDIMDYYKQNDPDEYRIVIIDHINLISPESGQDVRAAIDKLSSDYAVKLRNNYNYTLVFIQQQAAAAESLESFKASKMKPSATNLSENKATARDANVLLGLYAPFRHEIPSFNGYDIKKFKDKIRFLEIIVDRDGEGNVVTPLFFEGAVGVFSELPSPTETQELNKIYAYLDREKTTKIALLVYEDISISQNRLWKNNFFGKCSRIRYKGIKSIRNLYYKLCK